MPPISVVLLVLILAALSGFFQEWVALPAGLGLLWAAPILLRRIGGGTHLDLKDGLAIAWLIWLPLTLTWSRVADYGEAQVYTLALLPVVFLAWRHWPEATQAWHWVKILLWIGGGILALFGILEGPENTYVGKPDGPYIDPNVYAATLNLFWLPLTAFYFYSRPTRTRWQEGAMLLVLAIMALAFFMAASRGAGLAAILLFPFIFWKARGQTGYLERAIKFVLLVFYSYTLAALTLEQDLGSRLSETTQTGDPARIMLWKSTWQMILEHPFLGNGLGSFRMVYPLYRDPNESATAGGWAHNDYLQLWQEGGLFTLAFVLAFVMMFLIEGWRAFRQRDDESIERLGLMAGGLAIFIHASVNFILYFPILNILLGLYLARTFSIYQPTSLTGVMTLSIRPKIKSMAAWLLIVSIGYYLVTSIIIQSNLLFTKQAEKFFSRVMPSIDQIDRASWLSVLRPDLTLPYIIMANIFDLRLNLPDQFNDDLDTKLFIAGDAHFDQANARLPCYLPLVNYHIDFLYRNHHFSDGSYANDKVLQLARSNLKCNPRHGLSHAYLALALTRAGDIQAARATLKDAYPKVLFPAERDLLLATWLEIDQTPSNPDAIALRIKLMAQMQQIEFNPAVRVSPGFWQEVMEETLRLIREKKNPEASK